MHTQTDDQWRHSHDFHIDSSHGERRTLYVVILTTAMMMVEVIAGYAYGSMALLADGWHMGTHVAALSISLFAYRYARNQANNPYFSFGTGKVSSLGGFASAISLAAVALFMGAESVERLVSPEAIYFDEAILVATIGLIINLISAWLLHETKHGQEHSPQHHDQNLRAAYLHILADALTSLLAIFALVCGKAFGWIWMDAVMAIVAAAVILKWSLGLIAETSGVLLDGTPNRELAIAIKHAIESDGENKISDLHLWQVGPSSIAVIISLVSRHPREPAHYKRLLSDFEELDHTTIEVNAWPSETV